jgi:DNA polymerase-3 subunit gamma/tau
MSYQVLARKYRPKILSELVGQDILVKTLLSSIKKDKIAHAFILSGIRGVGKTTTARIIAKALNCIGENLPSIKSKPADPCGICSSCLSIEAGKHTDIIEIDAASRTGVDDIREIIENISYATSHARYKVYIIDEIHMLSNHAFNALLKTLEEPPSHVKFIFATTEIKKIPVTIISRCQRFDLKRISNKQIISHLEKILKKEDFSAEEEALQIISNCSEGSMRDAMSMTDQALAYNNYESELTADNVKKMIGYSDQSKIIDFIENILSGKTKECIEQFNEFYQDGIDSNVFMKDLLDIIHKITLNKTISDYQFNNLSSEAQEKIKKISQNISVASLARIWQMILKGISELKISTNSKMSTEMIIVRICYMSDIPNFEQLLSKKTNNSLENNKNYGHNHGNGIEKSILTNEILRNFPKSQIITENE